MNVEIPEFKTREDFETFVAELSNKEIQQMTSSEWNRLYKNLFQLIQRRFKNDPKIFLNYEADAMKKLYGNYRPSHDEIKHTRILAAKQVRQILRKHPDFKQKIIDFPSYDNKDKEKFLKKLKKSLHHNIYAFNPIRRLFAPGLTFAPINSPFTKGIYFDDRHRIHISNQQSLGEIPVLSHEFYHALQGYSKNEKVIRWLGGGSNIHLPQLATLFRANQKLYIKPSTDDKTYRQQPLEKFPFIFEEAFVEALKKEVGPENLFYDRLFTCADQISETFGLSDKIRRIYIKDNFLYADFTFKSKEDAYRIKEIKNCGLKLSFLQEKNYISCIFGKADKQLLQQMEKPMQERRMTKNCMELYGILKCVLRDCGLSAQSEIHLPIFSLKTKQITPSLQNYLQKLNPEQMQIKNGTINFNLKDMQISDRLNEHFFQRRLQALGVKNHQTKISCRNGKMTLRVFTSDPKTIKMLTSLSVHGKLRQQDNFYAMEFNTAKAIKDINSGDIKLPGHSPIKPLLRERS